LLLDDIAGAPHTVVTSVIGQLPLAGSMATRRAYNT